MDKHLSEEELRLQALILTKDFEALDEVERAFVLSETTEDEYCLERAIVVHGPTIFSEEAIEKPRPLVFPLAEKHTVLTARMPIYQTVLAVAATIVLMWLVIPRTYRVGNPIVQEKIVYHTDTITHEVLTHDTIIKYRDQPVYIDRPIYITETSVTASKKEAPRLLEVSPNIDLPELSASSITNPGHSIKDDGTAALITAF